MAKTQGVMLNEIRYRLDELVEGRWSNEELRMWINEGAKDVARRTKCFRDTDTVSVTADTQDYTLTSDVMELTRVEYSVTGEEQRYSLQYMDRHSLDQIWGSSIAITKGRPEFYTTWGMPPSLILSLYPTPSANASAIVYHYRLPTDLATAGEAAAGTAVDVPTGWEDVVQDYVEWRAFLKDGRAERALVAKQEYMERVAGLQATAERFNDQPGQWDHDVGYHEGADVFNEMM